jgi:transposase InsO family protein
MAWERTYNTLRPHQALDWHTPRRVSQGVHPEVLHVQLSHMY